jgi:hypothetical protein
LFSARGGGPFCDRVARGWRMGAMLT